MRTKQELIESLSMERIEEFKNSIALRIDLHEKLYNEWIADYEKKFNVDINTLHHTHKERLIKLCNRYVNRRCTRIIKAKYLDVLIFLSTVTRYDKKLSAYYHLNESFLKNNKEDQLFIINKYKQCKLENNRVGLSIMRYITLASTNTRRIRYYNQSAQTIYDCIFNILPDWVHRLNRSMFLSDTYVDNLCNAPLDFIHYLYREPVDTWDRKCKEVLLEDFDYAKSYDFMFLLAKTPKDTLKKLFKLARTLSSDPGMSRLSRFSTVNTGFLKYNEQYKLVVSKHGINALAKRFNIFAPFALDMPTRSIKYLNPELYNEILVFNKICQTDLFQVLKTYCSSYLKLHQNISEFRHLLYTKGDNSTDKTKIQILPALADFEDYHVKTVQALICISRNHASFGLIELLDFFLFGNVLYAIHRRSYNLTAHQVDATPLPSMCIESNNKFIDRVNALQKAYQKQHPRGDFLDKIS